MVKINKNNLLEIIFLLTIIVITILIIILAMLYNNPGIFITFFSLELTFLVNLMINKKYGLKLILTWILLIISYISFYILIFNIPSILIRTSFFLQLTIFTRTLVASLAIVGIPYFANKVHNTLERLHQEGIIKIKIKINGARTPNDININVFLGRLRKLLNGFTNWRMVVWALVFTLLTWSVVSSSHSVPNSILQMDNTNITWIGCNNTVLNKIYELRLNSTLVGVDNKTLEKVRPIIKEVIPKLQIIDFHIVLNIGLFFAYMSMLIMVAEYRYLKPTYSIRHEKNESEVLILIFGQTNNNESENNEGNLEKLRKNIITFLNEVISILVGDLNAQIKTYRMGVRKSSLSYLHPDKNFGLKPLLDMFFKGILLIVISVLLIFFDVISFAFPTIFLLKINLLYITPLTLLAILLITIIVVSSYYYSIDVLKNLLLRIRRDFQHEILNEINYLRKLYLDSTVYLDYSGYLKIIEYLEKIPKFPNLYIVSTVITMVPLYISLALFIGQLVEIGKSFIISLLIVTILMYSGVKIIE